MINASVNTAETNRFCERVVCIRHYRLHRTEHKQTDMQILHKNPREFRAYRSLQKQQQGIQDPYGVFVFTLNTEMFKDSCDSLLFFDGRRQLTCN